MLYLLIVIAVWLSGTILVVATLVQSERQNLDITLNTLLVDIILSLCFWPLTLIIVYGFPFVSRVFKKLFEWINFDRVIIKKKTDKYSSMKPHDWSD